MSVTPFQQRVSESVSRRHECRYVSFVVSPSEGTFLNYRGAIALLRSTPASGVKELMDGLSGSRYTKYLVKTSDRNRDIRYI